MVWILWWFIVCQNLWYMGGKHDNKEWGLNWEHPFLGFWDIIEGATLRRLKSRSLECICLEQTINWCHTHLSSHPCCIHAYFSHSSSQTPLVDMVRPCWFPIGGPTYTKYLICVAHTTYYSSSSHIDCLAITGWQLERVSKDTWCNYMTSHEDTSN